MSATQWRRCGCVELERLGRKPTAHLSSFQVQILHGLPDKARTYPGSRVVQVDRDQWRAWSALQRQAVLEHEAAHEEDPTACEACTDARAGARMRWAGVSLDAAMEALGSVVQHRQARGSVRVGWLAANQAMQGRGSSRPMKRGAELAPVEGSDALPKTRQLAMRGGQEGPHGVLAPLSVDGYEDPIDEISYGVPDVEGTSYGLPDLYPNTPRPGGSRSRTAPNAPGAPGASGAPTAPRASSGAGWLIVGALALAAGIVLIVKRR